MPLGTTPAVRLGSSPFGRRLMLLVMSSALIPILSLGAVAYWAVGGHLRKEAQRQLRQQAKAMGMSVLERLLFVEASLDLLAPKLAGGWSENGRSESVLDRAIQRRFDWMCVVRGDGRFTTLFGQPPALPAVNPAMRRHLAEGRTQIVSRDGSGPMSQIWAGRAISPDALEQGVLWARVSESYLWGIGVDNTLPPLAELMVLDEEGFLVRSTDVPADLASRLRAGEESTTDIGVRWTAETGDVFFASRRVLPMATRYAAGAWIVSISRPRNDILGPLARFRAMFAQVIAITLLAALLVSRRLIHRLLVPVSALSEGTVRIAGGDFATPVRVTSGDELEHLADAFNRMSHRIGCQLAESSAMAAVDRAALVEERVERVAAVALACFPAVVQADDLRIVLRAPGGGWRELRQTSDGGLQETLSESVAAVGEPVHELVIPVGTERADLGWLHATRQPPQQFDAQDGERLRALTDHLALALDHLDLRSRLEVERLRLARLVEDLPHGVVVLGSDHRVLLSNRLGRDLVTALGIPEGSDRIDALAGRPLAGLAASDGAGGVRWNEIEIDGPPARAFSIAVSRLSAAPTESDAGGPILVLRDVTSVRAAQARAQRQDRLATVGRSAAGITHDFNNILQAIMMAVQMLHVKAPGKETELIINQCRRAGDMVSRLLDFSRDTPHRPANVDLRRVTEEGVLMIAGTLPASVRLALSLPKQALWCQADATQIQRVVQNLVVNARDAMSKKGGTLEVRLRGMPARELPPAASTEACWLQLQVSDQGPGIPPAVRDRVFDPFFTTKKPGVGTGLGLVQVQGIVEQHGGHVTIETDASGTTFSIFLQASDPPESEVTGTDAALGVASL